MTSQLSPWFPLKNPEKIPSPALLVSLDGMHLTLATMVRFAGDVNRLRPHVKTYKMPEVLRLTI